MIHGENGGEEHRPSAPDAGTPEDPVALAPLDPNAETEQDHAAQDSEKNFAPGGGAEEIRERPNRAQYKDDYANLDENLDADELLNVSRALLRRGSVQGRRHR